MKSTIVLRIAIAIILIMHSVPGMFNNSINDFGNLYLNNVGFAPFGVLFAWLIKLSHVAAAFFLLLNKFIKPTAIITIFILILGIIMVHFTEGWYVVGGGRNGVEFNFLLICALLTIMFPNGFSKEVKK